jgi:hypothetical protein
MNFRRQAIQMEMDLQTLWSVETEGYRSSPVRYPISNQRHSRPPLEST